MPDVVVPEAVLSFVFFIVHGNASQKYPLNCLFTRLKDLGDTEVHMQLSPVEARRLNKY